LTPRLAFSSLFLAALAAAPAQAAVNAIGIADFAPGGSLQDFSGVPLGTDINGLTVGGLSFSYSLGSGQVSIATGPGSTNNMTDPNIVSVGSPGGTLVVTLPGPSLQFGYGFALLASGTISNGTTITLFDGSTPVGSLSYTAAPDPSFPGGFAGINSTQAFTQVQLSFSSAAVAWAVDNMRVTPVPEPATWALWSLGLCALLGARRARPARD
jgi:hypothetical protein